MLKVDNIDVEIAGAYILRNITISIEPGSIYGLIGRNGAGKTTLLKTIMGILKPKRGKIILNNIDITKYKPSIRALMGISYVPEDMKIFPWLTARENIDLAIILSKNQNTRKEIYNMIYSIFPEMRKLLDRKGIYLSGGEKKMVAIARALALKPKYIIIDEAFEGLAPIVIDRFRNAVSEIKKHGVGILIAESNISLATMIADYVYVIERGEIIYSGDPKEALKDPNVATVLKGSQ